MPNFLPKITRHTKKQESVTFRTIDWAHMLNLADQNVKTVIINIFKDVKENTPSVKNLQSR